MSESEIESYTSIAEEIDEGLSASPKRISSKFFYDEKGSKIFQEIMEMPSYYLTESEFEILAEQSKEIVDSLQFGNEFSIIELGAGDGTKTLQLLKYIDRANIKCYYRPIDISSEAVNQLETTLKKELKNVKIQPLIGDYFEVLNNLENRNRPALFLFLGSNIGNYEREDAVDLLTKINNALQIGDALMVGFDMLKNPRTILEAYDDSRGVTMRFNLNLLERLNRELEMNFHEDCFEFFPHYNPVNGELRSCLVSLKKQTVYSKALNKEYHFEANELIHTELSKKYSIREIGEMAEASNYEVVRNFHDRKRYFVDSLWKK